MGPPKRTALLPVNNADTASNESSFFNMVVAISVFLISGPLLVVMNRYFIKGGGNFPYPIFLSSVGVFSTGIVTRLLVFLKVLSVNHNRPPWYKLHMFGFCSSVSMSSGNAAYLYLSVAFIQMLKAGTPVVIMTMLQLSGLEKMSPRAQLAIFAMALSSMITSVGEISLHWIGLGLMLLSEIVEGTKVVLMQSFLGKKEVFNVIDGLYHLQPILGFWLVLLSLLQGELSIIIGNSAYMSFLHHPYETLLMLVLAYAVNWSSYMVIKTTSGLLMKLLVSIRNAGLVVFASMFYDEPITVIQFFGYVLTLASFLVYSYFKMTDPIHES